MRINLFGSPGSGKSTLAARLFADLKAKHYNIEIVQEYIKTWAYQKKVPQSFDQVYLFAKQMHFEDLIFQSGVEHLITDSPLYMQPFYSKTYNFIGWTELFALAELYDKARPSVNIFLDNQKVPYQAFGRYETESQANQVHCDMVDFLTENSIPFYRCSPLDYADILKYIESGLSLVKRRSEEGPVHNYGV